MYLSKNPTFRFWVTVYSVPAVLPLILYLGFDMLVSKDLANGLGTSGPVIVDDIRHALFASFGILMVFANLAAFWHASTGKPGIPAVPATQD
jgi:hypothetical protein